MYAPGDPGRAEVVTRRSETLAIIGTCVTQRCPRAGCCRIAARAETSRLPKLDTRTVVATANSAMHSDQAVWSRYLQQPEKREHLSVDQVGRDGSNTAYVQDEYQVTTISDINDKWEKVRAHLRRAKGVWDTHRAGENGVRLQTRCLVHELHQRQRLGCAPLHRRRRIADGQRGQRVPHPVPAQRTQQRMPGALPRPGGQLRRQAGDGTHRHRDDGLPRQPAHRRHHRAEPARRRRRPQRRCGRPDGGAPRWRRRRRQAGRG